METGKLLKAQSSSPAEEAYKLRSQQVSRMTAAEAAKLLRPQSKGHKSHRERNKRVPIKMLLQEVTSTTIPGARESLGQGERSQFQLRNVG